LIDFHVLHTISNGVKYYKENQADFLSIFNDVSEAYALKLFNKLADVNVTFNVGFQKKVESFPLITLTVEEFSDDTDNQVLGNRGYALENITFINQQCSINVYSSDIDILRVLHRIIQTSMLLFKKDFFRVGYINIEFVKSSDMEPEDGLVGKDVAVYKRLIKYNAQRQITAKPINIDETASNWELVPTIINNTDL
jgi:hypothetical protein